MGNVSPIKTDETKATKIDTADMAYHQHVTDQVKETQAVVQSWSSYLSRKYQLGPQDRVEPSGEIRRL